MTLEAWWWVWKQMEKLMRDSILSVASTRFCRSASAKKIHYKNVKNDRELRGSPCSLNLCSAARIWSLTHVLCWSPFTCRCLTWIRLCWVCQSPRCAKVDGREKGSFSTHLSIESFWIWDLLPHASTAYHNGAKQSWIWSTHDTLVSDMLGWTSQPPVTTSLLLSGLRSWESVLLQCSLFSFHTLKKV